MDDQINLEEQKENEKSPETVMEDCDLNGRDFKIAVIKK